MEPIHRLVIADDQSTIRRSLKALFSSQPDFQVVGEAADGINAIRSARRLRPDLILLDLAMPRLGGKEAIPEIKKAHPPAKILVLTAQPAEEALFSCLRAGADGFLMKQAEFDELLLAARRVAQGHTYVTSEIRASFLRE